MLYPELTLVERAILANQYRILSYLEGNERHLYRASILENGYETLYREIFQGISSDVFSEEAGSEIHAILTMFRMIDSAKTELSEEQLQQVRRLSFVGFDHHGEAKEYLFVKFLVEEAGLYQELRGRNLEPVGDRLPEYRRVLGAYIDSGMRNSFDDLSFDNLMELQEYI